MLTTPVILHRAFSVTKISMFDLFLKGGEGAEHLLSTQVGRQIQKVSKVTCGYVSQKYSSDSVEGF